MIGALALAAVAAGPQDQLDAALRERLGALAADARVPCRVVAEDGPPAIRFGPDDAPTVLVLFERGARAEDAVAFAALVARGDGLGLRLSRVAVEVWVRPLAREHAHTFPVDWELALDAVGRERAGPYPLASVAARALARRVLTSERAFAALVLGDEPIDGRSFAVGDPDTDALHERLATLAAEADAPRARAEPGGLARFCRRGAGLVTVGARAPRAARPDGAGGARLVAVLAALVDAAPRLEIGAPAWTRAGRELWQLDLVVSNAGALPTGDATHASRRRPRGVTLALDRPDAIVAAAVRRSGDPAHVPARVGPSGLALGDLGPGEHVAVRLFLRGPFEPALGARAATPRAPVVERPLDPPDGGAGR